MIGNNYLECSGCCGNSEIESWLYIVQYTLREEKTENNTTNYGSLKGGAGGRSFTTKLGSNRVYL